MSSDPLPPAASPKPKKKRRALRIALYVLGTPLVLVTLLVAYLHTSSGKARVKAAIVERLRERVNGQVELGTVDYALFGDVRVGELHLKDEGGAPAVSLTSLSVSPSWGDLLRGRLVVSNVAVSGVAVHIVKDADGSSNLSRLIKPVPEDPQKKPLDKRVEVRSIQLEKISVDILQPDGTNVALGDVAIAGALSVLPADKSADIELAKVALTAQIDKGPGALKLGLTGLETGLSVHVAKGAGKATLHPLKGHVGVTLPDGGERGFDIGLEGFSADIGEGGVGVSLDKLLAGAVALASVEVKGKLSDGQIDGSQQADVVGLKVRGTTVNELLGRDVLLGDIDVETHVLGPPEKIAITTKITTPGAAVAIDGAVGVKDAASPTYDVAVTVTDVDTDKVLAPALGISRVAVEKVEAKVTGQGRKADAASAVAKLKVTGVTAKGVRIDGLDFEGELEKGILKVRALDAKALGQRITASGEVEVATKRVDLTLGMEGDIGDVLAKLKAAGLPIQAKVPRGAVRLPPGDLRITAKGVLNGEIDLTASAKKLTVFGGRVGLDASASVIRHDPPQENGKKLTVTALDADLHIGGVKLSSILASRGKTLTGVEGTIEGDIHVEGTPQNPKAKVVLGLATTRADGGKTARVALVGDIAKSKADLKVSLLPTGETAELFGLTASLPLSLGGEKKGVDPNRPLDIHASLPKRTFAEIWSYWPDALLPEGVKKLIDGGFNVKLIPGDIALALDVKGTAKKPDAHLHATVSAKAVIGHDRSQKVDIDVVLSPSGDNGSSALTAKADVGVWLDAAKPKLIQLHADADLSRSPILGPSDIGYHVQGTIGPISPKDLYMADDEVRALQGTWLTSLDLKGNKQDLTGSILISADGLKKDEKGPLALGASVDLGETGTKLDIKLRGPAEQAGASGGDLATIKGTVGLAGKGLFAQLKDKEHLDPQLALVLDIPRRALQSLAWLRPNLKDAPGNLSGAIPITGTAKMPLAKGAIVITDVPRADGKMGGAKVALDITSDELRAAIGVGLADETSAPLRLIAKAPRAPLAKLKDGETLPISATISAGKVSLGELVPAALVSDSQVKIAGTVDWSMDIEAAISRPKEAKGMEVTQASVKGTLDVHDGTIGLAGKRAYRDVRLLLKADEKGIVLDALRAKESDAEVKERTLSAKGSLILDKLKPVSAELNVSADKWLVFGSSKLGRADAPRGTISLALDAKADFSAPIRKVTASIQKFELLVPERFERAHQPEDAHAGDLVFLGEDATKLGKLPVPGCVAEQAKKAAETKSAPAKKDVTPYDIDVHIADGAHLLQAPIDLWPKGDVSVKIRPEGREVHVNLAVKKGGLSLTGVDHNLVSGAITFNEKNPKCGAAPFLDLYFERPMRPAALRQISEASGGTSVKIHMFGSLSDRKTVLGGAGTAGALWDVLSMHNTGRARYVSEPDLPWSMSSEFPQHDSLLVLGFLAVNLPHLLFVDRFAAWGDPYDDPRAYGKITHFEAERFAAGNALRFRLGARPAGAGQSEAEAEIDYVIVNVPRMLLGVGLTGGTRGGGGPGFVWEWSSKD